MSFITTFAHAGHDHSTGAASGLDHCMPIIIGAGIVILLLTLVIVYLITQWQPKPRTAARPESKTKSKE